MQIQLNFSSPMDISSDPILDKLEIFFSESSSLIKCLVNNVTQEILNYTLVHLIPKQILSNQKLIFNAVS
jgi:hypothetical protein